MKKLHSRLPMIVWVLMAALCVAMLFHPVKAQTAPAAVVQALKAGGHVVVIRHGFTYQDQADIDPLNPADCSKQRMLNVAGQAQASMTGALFAIHGIKVQEVTTSVFCRARETGRRIAELANSSAPQLPSLDFSEVGQVTSPNENKRRIDALKAAVTKSPAAGNSVIVTHKPNLVDAFGAPWLNIREGEISVWKAGVFVGRITVDDLIAAL